jgi:chaperonin GroEL
MLEDLAVLTGGRLIAEELGVKLETVGPPDLGNARRVVVDRENTTIIGGAGAREAIEARCQELRDRIADATSDYDREKLEERLAKLAGGVAVIRVGAPSEAEMKNRKDAFDDAIASTRAAVAEGIVPGGGVALIRATGAVLEEATRCTGDEALGVRILAQALETPTRQIAANSGADPGVVVERVRSATGAQGFDGRTGAYRDLVEAGIVDPTKVVRLALENAVSVAGTLLLTEATLTERREKKEEAAAGGPDLD